MLKKYSFILKGLDCAHCAMEVQERIAKESDFKNVIVNFSTLKLTYEAESEQKGRIIELVKSVEPDVDVLDIKERIEENSSNKTKLQIIRLIIGIMIALVGFFANLPKIVKNVFIIIAYIILLYRTIGNAIKLLKKSKNIDENFLVTISCFGAFLVGEQFEGLMVIILYEIGKILEEKAINKTRHSVSDLMNIKPEYANLKENGEAKEVNPEIVDIGDIIIVKQGEKIPLDGIVINGNANLDTSALTGESKLRKVAINDEVLSGSINTDNVIEIKVTKKYEDSTVNRILDLVENATDKKAKTETLVTKFSRIYTPAVIVLAAIVAIFLPIINKNITYTGGYGSIYKALIFLVISCPCAIAISVPLSYFSGIGKASKNGILIKGSDYLDALKDLKQIVLDKTGTITKGKFEISEIKIYESSTNKDEILKLAVLGESFSNHPIAKSILENAKIDVDASVISEYKEISGKGISYKLENENVLIGNSDLVETDIEENGTIIFVKKGEKLLGSIVLNDTIKDGSINAINSLKGMGIIPKMFTGDNSKIALDIAQKVGIDDIKAEMLPTDKYNEMEKILSERNENDKIAFVGDGINDSPVLAIADVGISMGGVGSHSAIEASDVVIMTDNLEKIIDAIKISNKTCKIIKQNLIFAITVKILVLIFSTIGITGMWQAIFSDVGVTLITIFNTLRILK